MCTINADDALLQRLEMTEFLTAGSKIQRLQGLKFETQRAISQLYVIYTTVQYLPHYNRTDKILLHIVFSI
jgi:hypothetical protein